MSSPGEVRCRSMPPGSRCRLICGIMPPPRRGELYRLGLLVGERPRLAEEVEQGGLEDAATHAERGAVEVLARLQVRDGLGHVDVLDGRQLVRGGDPGRLEAAL